jgi:cobalt-zinc-cadmium efflux system membrane fusion protein
MATSEATPVNMLDSDGSSKGHPTTGNAPASGSSLGVRKRSMRWKLVIVIVVIAGAGVFATFKPEARTQAAGVWQQVAATARKAGPAWERWTASRNEANERSAETSEPSSAPAVRDGYLVVPEFQQKAIRLMTTAVKKQSDATLLTVPGTTDYDPATLTVVRTQFDARCDEVLVDIGDTVKKGQPLLEVFSNVLAEAKSALETATNQWIHDKKVLDFKKPLAEAGTLPRKELIEIENDEAQSRLAMKLAKDKLLVFGLTEEEIQKARSEDGVQKAEMTIRSRADGIIIKRAVVQGNYYKQDDDLMAIAPLDHLWVRGSVSELDADKVQVGQNLRVIFPYINRSIPAKVEHIDKAIDPDTRTVKFRTSVPNLEKRLRASMFVRVVLEIPPNGNHTVIPRVAMVSLDPDNYVFVKKPGSTDAFQRRLIMVDQEDSEKVIVEPAEGRVGLQPGEEVVTTGSLILEQAYEDRVVTESGTPL